MPRAALLCRCAAVAGLGLLARAGAPALCPRTAATRPLAPRPMAAAAALQAKAAPAKELRVGAAARKLRILALHGGMQDAGSFRGKMKNTVKWTREVAEYTFVDAPFAATCPDFARCAEEDVQKGVFRHWEPEPSPSKRSWWRWNPHDASDERYACCGYHQEALVYQGLDESLAALLRVWREQGPFDGIFGFSQGAVMASMLTSALERGLEGTATEGAGVPNVPGFVVLVSAFLSPVPLNVPEYWCVEDALAGQLGQLQGWRGEDGAPLACLPMDHFLQPVRYAGDEQTTQLAIRESVSRVPSLHIFGSGDQIMPPARSRFLAQRYEGAEVHQHNFRRGHEVPQNREDVEVLAAFLRARQGAL